MKDLLEQAFVKKESIDGVLYVTFYHPRSNSLPRTMLSQLANCITEAGDNPDNKVVVLRSSGHKAFCAGASFDELLSLETEEEGTFFFKGFGEVILAIRACPLLVICRVHGKTVGGGVGIAAAADYTLATSNASIKLSELAIGIGPFVVGPAVERKMGLSAFQSLAIDTTQWFSAQWANEHGLYAKVLPTDEELDSEVKRLAKELAKSSREAMSELKKATWNGTDHWEELLPERAAISGRLILSDYTRRTIQAFKSK